MTIAVILLAVALIVVGAQYGGTPPGWIVIALSVVALLLAAGVGFGAVHLR